MTARPTTDSVVIPTPRASDDPGPGIQGMRQQPPADLEQSLYMVADTNGAPHSALGLEKGFRQVLVQALGPRGRELARGPFPEAAGAINRALTAPSPSLVSAISR